jgi:hypothetical protein
MSIGMKSGRARSTLGALVAGSMALSAGCSRPTRVTTQAVEDAQPRTDRAEVVKSTKQVVGELAARLPSAQIVFVGRVLEVSASPGIWSGLAEMTQEVTYVVERVLGGSGLKPGDQVQIAHLLVDGSATADSSTVQLRPSMFHKGASLIVLASASTTGGEGASGVVTTWRAVDEEGSVAPATPELELELQRRLTAK